MRFIAAEFAQWAGKRDGREVRPLITNGIKRGWVRRVGLRKIALPDRSWGAGHEFVTEYEFTDRGLSAYRAMKESAA